VVKLASVDRRAFSWPGLELHPDPAPPNPKRPMPAGFDVKRTRELRDSEEVVSLKSELEKELKDKTVLLHPPYLHPPL